MKHLIPKTMAGVSVLALALAVGGCGSSSKTADTDTDTDTDTDNGDGTELVKPGLTAMGMALATAIGPDATPSTRVSAVILQPSGKPLEMAMDGLEMSSMSIADLGADWDGAAYQRMNTDEDDMLTSTDYVVVYSNEEDPVPSPFAVEYPLDANPDSDDADQSLNIATRNVMKVSGVADFPSAASQVNIAFDDDAEFMGLFDGAPGTYKCNDDNCTLSTDDDGKLNAAAGMWWFTPAERSMVPVKDMDFMHFGYWLNDSMNDDDELVYDAVAFAGGTTSSDTTDVESLEGMATYSGAATGLYLRKELDASGDPLNLYHGQFTATAKLTAYFVGTDVAQSKQNSVMGKITDFNDGGGDAIDSSWSVDLERTGLMSGMITDGMTEGDKDMMGDWTATFFGEVALDSDDDEDGNQSTFPSGIGGTFDGHFTNGHVLGGFGATMDEE